MSCSICERGNCVKDGVVKGRQRYLCKACGYRHSVRFRGKSPALKRQALELYLEGLGFRSIGRFLKCSHVAVYHWIKAYSESIETIRSASGVDIIEMDDMHTYIGAKKNSCWIWIAVERDAKQFLHGVLGARDTATGKQLWEVVKQNTLQGVMSDYWKPYEHFIPQAIHTQSKAETYTVEGYNSLFRHFLDRLRRKSKCYSKSQQMLQLFRYTLNTQMERKLRIYI